MPTATCTEWRVNLRVTFIVDCTGSRPGRADNGAMTTDLYAEVLATFDAAARRSRASPAIPTARR